MLVIVLGISLVGSFDSRSRACSSRAVSSNNVVFDHSALDSMQDG